jgi:hypothetical protein
MTLPAFSLLLLLSIVLVFVLPTPWPAAALAIVTVGAQLVLRLTVFRRDVLFKPGTPATSV